MRRRPISSSLLATGLAALGTVAACGDPVLDQQIASFGPEKPDVPQGEFHRAGQACVACHQDGGPAGSKPFSVAGTVFAQPGSNVGIGGVTVAMTDAVGSVYTVKTNCVGNFFVPRSAWDPSFPILARVWKETIPATQTMRGAIFRERSCNKCHANPPNVTPQQLARTTDPRLTLAGVIYLVQSSQPAPAPDANCPVDPALKTGTMP
jgi:cytochrome c551/c552